MRVGVGQANSKLPGIWGVALFFVMNGAVAACIPTTTAAGPTPVMAGAGQLTYASGTTVNGTTVTGNLNGIPTTGVTTTAAPTLPALTPATFPTGSLGSNTITSAGPIAAGSYGTINATGNPTVFSGGTYYINTLNANGSIRLGPGTYYINNLNLNNANSSVTLTGAVQIFIGSSLNVNGNNVSVNAGGNAGNLQVNLYNNAQIDTNGKNNFSFTGLIYSPFTNAEVQMGGNNNSITGAIITASEVQLGQNTAINYNATVQAQITALACPVAGPDHIEIDHTGSALTCSPQTVTIKACANAACSVLYTAGGVNVTLTPGGSAYAIDSTGINNAAAVQQTTAGAATLAAASTPAAVGPTTCFVTGTPSCTMTFSNAGFLVTVPNHTSCTNATATVEAVQTAPGTGRCVPAYKNVSRLVHLYSTYSSPTTGTQVITASTGAVSTAAPGSTHNLAFDATGKATITLSYPDAGSLTLTANDTAPTGAAMTGGSTFVVAPAAFAFSGIPAAPLTAGQPFNVTVTAMNACAAATPNFNGAVTNGIVMLTSSNPLPGIGNAITINTALTGFVNGVASANLIWNEVGTIDLNASLSSYLGWTPTVPVSSTQANVGRFRPAYFETTATPTCGSFSYAGSTAPTKAGQPFTVTVTANKMNGGVTNNYAGAYAFATTLSDAGTTAGFANNVIAAASFINGAGSNANVAYAVPIPQTAPLTLTLRAVDADAVSSSGHTEASMPVRSGRLKLSNAHGAETLNLPVPMIAEYWAGTGYTINTLDSCTVVPAPVPGVTLVLSGITTTATLNNPFISGNGGLQLSKPNARGYADITPNAPVWLQYGWGGAGVVNPTARATFGVYKGANEIIYMRENY